MGYMRHHAVLVTTWSKDRMADLVAFLLEEKIGHLGPHVTKVNDYHTVVIPPDGSKEGWEESDAGEEERQMVIAKIKTFSHDDGSNPFDWALVRYGDDGEDDKIEDGSARNMKKS